MAPNGRTSVSYIGDERDLTAHDRDGTSEAHDRTSDARDERSEARDRRAVNRERDQSRLDPGTVSDRTAAKRDRQSSAGDRRHARHDRWAASADRHLAARDRSFSVLDGLTRAHLREPGLAELEREIVKAERTGDSFVLAFVDVDGLKAMNDAHGHGAGDELLKQVVATIRGKVREYDLIVRYGGDEFLCGLLGVSLADTAGRLQEASTRLAGSGGATFTVGLAELSSGEGLDDLVKRADQAMYEARSRLEGATKT